MDPYIYLLTVRIIEAISCMSQQITITQRSDNLNQGKGRKVSLHKLVTIVEGDLKALFLIATTPRCKGGHYSFIWIAPLNLWYVPYNAECQAKKYQVPFLKSLVWPDLGLNPGLLDHWRTLYPLHTVHYFLLHIWLYCCSLVRLLKLNNISL